MYLPGGQETKSRQWNSGVRKIHLVFLCSRLTMPGHVWGYTKLCKVLKSSFIDYFNISNYNKSKTSTGYKKASSTNLTR